VLFLLFLLLPLRLFCVPSIEAYNITPVKTFLENAQTNDLVVFDVDCTLFIPEDLSLRPAGKAFFLKQFAEFSKTMPEEQIKLLGSKILLERSIRHVEEDTLHLVQSLQTRNIKTIALSSLFTGRFGQISYMEEWRIAELKKLGYDFTSAFPRYSHIVFGDIIRKDSLPIFKDGVLFSARHSKGEILQAFLRRIKWTPKRVIFIDDSLESLESVSEAMEQDGIAYVGIHYRAHEKLDGVFSEAVAMKQFDHLKIKEKWLSDTEIKAE